MNSYWCRNIFSLNTNFCISILHNNPYKQTNHLNDSVGNIHINVTLNEYKEQLKDRMETYIYKYVQKCRGSISAEHGLGLVKNESLHYSLDCSL